jgi:hypothetical protein
MPTALAEKVGMTNTSLLSQLSTRGQRTVAKIQTTAIFSIGTNASKPQYHLKPAFCEILQGTTKKNAIINNGIDATSS